MAKMPDYENFLHDIAMKALEYEFKGKTIREWVYILKDYQSSKWISVDDRLPDESEGTILVCFPNVAPYNRKEPFFNAKHDRRVTTAKYSEHSKRWYIGDMCAVGEVFPVYWMPLPEPPKE